MEFNKIADSLTDQLNTINFRKYHLEYEEEPLYNCVLCNNKTSLADSISNKGHRLICWNCYKKHFVDYREYFQWSTLGYIDGINKAISLISSLKQNVEKVYSKEMYTDDVAFALHMIINQLEELKAGD